MNTSIYGSRIPTDSEDQVFVSLSNTNGTYPDGTSTCTEGFYVLITGANPNATVARVRMSFCGQFIPTTPSIGLSVMAYPHPGIAT